MKSTEVRKLKLVDLQKYAQEVGIEIVTEQGNKKKTHLLDEVVEYLRQKRKEDSTEVRVTDDHIAIAEDQTLNKSERMRQLHDAGLSITTISNLLNAHYSFVHGTIGKYELKKKVAKIEEESSEDVVIAKKKPTRTKKTTTKAKKKSTSSRKKQTA